MIQRTRRFSRAFIRNLAAPLPDKPGRYFWSEWGSLVTVTKRGRSLYVTPPCKGAIEIKITPRSAGIFTEVKDNA